MTSEHAAPSQGKTAPAGAELSPRGLTTLWAAPPEQRCFDVVIVGSGYGGSMAAAVLAGCTVDDDRGGCRPLRLCLLERGAHRLPGTFPSRLAEVARELRIGHQDSGQLGGNPEGLLDLRPGPDVHALVGNGLGGGSLINAGVLLPPQPDDLRGPWFSAHLRALLDEGHVERARRELGGVFRDEAKREVANSIVRHPLHARSPLKPFSALGTLADVDSGSAAEAPPLSVSMAEEANAQGVVLPACTLCGDCLSGCNLGAKNSLDVSLLQRAAREGGEHLQVFTGASVRHVREELQVDRPEPPRQPGPNDHGPTAAEAPVPHRWTVLVEHTRGDLQARESGPLEISTRYVILAAGALGSTEILLRSQAAGLAVAGPLGTRFSGNGDNIATIDGLPQAADAIADERTPLSGRRVGPTITGSLRMHGRGPGGRPFLLQGFAVPGPLARLFAEVATTAAHVQALERADESTHGDEPEDAMDPAAVDTERLRHTLMVGFIGHDDAGGRLSLAARGDTALEPGDAALGTVRIDWPEARAGAALDAAQAAVRERLDDLARRDDQADATVAPVLVNNPLWRPLPPGLEDLTAGARGPVLTVHPLGGCPMGASPEDGVVDACGRVFSGRASVVGAPAPVHEGLAVLDGAIVPESLGVNPALTIAALALRAAEALREAWGLQGGPGLGGQAPWMGGTGRGRPMRPPLAPAPGEAPQQDTVVEIVERLSGTVWLRQRLGPPRPWVLELTLAYERQALEDIARTLRRVARVDAAHPQTRLRLFDAATWAARGLDGLDDDARAPHVVLEAGLSGQLAFLHREPSFSLQRRARALRAWLRHRGARDLFQAWGQRWAGGEAGPRRVGSVGLGDLIAQAWNLASRAGEVRRFDYRLTLCGVRSGPGATASPPPQDLEGAELLGAKRLTYSVAGNPWRQLTELQVLRMPGLAGGRPHRLCVDLRFLAQRGRMGAPLLRIVSQADQVAAIAGLAGFGLTLARILLGMHLWTFRLPDQPGRGDPPRPTPPAQRLPGPIPGVPHPLVTWLRVDPGHATVIAGDVDPVALRDPAVAHVRLAHYPAAVPGRHPPLVMIHGYSVSGNTFTHPSIQPSAAQWFHAQGREVWVLDLRTSAALPTATQAWSMEQVGRVDIPAALLHVRKVSGQRVDVLAHCIGCAMLSMALLSDAEEMQRLARERGEPCALEPAHLAQLQAFNGVGGPGVEHPVVRRVVLSQKGPVLRYTSANVLRGWVMQYARRWLLREGWTFEPSTEPGLREQLLDRLLASLPYPDADWAVENPLAFWRRTPWTASRHRMDALYGRDFNAQRLRPETLAAIDELFGPMNLETVAQTIAFTRLDQVTDREGRGDFVTTRQLRERWSGIPTLALHGEDNGLVDAFTQRLLAAQLGAAGVPFEALTLPGVGHQDLLIGRDTARVWSAIAAFLERPAPCAAAPQAAGPAADAGLVARADAGPVVRPPWIGPRIDILDGRPRVAAMPAPDQGRATLVLVPVHRMAGGAVRRAGRKGFTLSPDGPGPSGVWQFATPAAGEEVNLTKTAVETAVETAEETAAGMAGAAGLDGWVAVMVADAGEASAVPLDFAWDGMNGPAPVRPAQGAPRPLEQALDTWMATRPEAARQAFVPLRALQVQDVRTQASCESPVFAFASCQYPSGPVDAACAQASLERLAALADRAETADTADTAEPDKPGQAITAASEQGVATRTALDRVDLVLLLGDQIYADATAGLVDPTVAHERYDAPHEAAQRASGLRRLMARVPVVMGLDDHELTDNWEPRPQGAGSAEVWGARERARLEGTRAFWHWARARPKPQPVPPVTDTVWRFAGVPFRMCDTRLGRQARGAGEPPAHILQAWQFDTLEAWLVEHREVLKFVATASLLLPRRREVAADAANAARGDAWDAFPASLDRLLDFIARERIERTVFVSGDEHHALACEVWLKATGPSGLVGPAVKLISLHSSALYAPFPFANGRPEDLSAAPFVTPAGTRVDMRVTPAPPGDGFALASPSRQGDALEVAFVKADGRRSRHRYAWGDAAPHQAASGLI